MKGRSRQAKCIGHERWAGREDRRYEDYRDILANITVCARVCVWLSVMAHATLARLES